MSDPVEQGEQVDVERLEIAYTAVISQRDRYRTSLEAARERVRLLEQREKGLRELVVEAYQGEPPTNLWRQRAEDLNAWPGALAASPPNEPNDG